MENSNKPAFPFNPNRPWDNESASGYLGLTKREHFASVAMQGLISDPTLNIGIIEIAKLSVTYANALLKELEENPNP